MGLCARQSKLGLFQEPFAASRGLMIGDEHRNKTPCAALESDAAHQISHTFACGQVLWVAHNSNFLIFSSNSFCSAFNFFASLKFSFSAASSFRLDTSLSLSLRSLSSEDSFASGLLSAFSSLAAGGFPPDFLWAFLAFLMALVNFRSCAEMSFVSCVERSNSSFAF